jgi:deoxyribodipyrimidine photo-lyase
MAEHRFVYRFARDLRLDDHAGLGAAAERGAVLPLLILDSSLIARLVRSPRRAAFFCGAAAALDADLRDRGSRLIVRRGDAGATLVRLVRDAHALGVAWGAAYDAPGSQADRRLQSELEEAGCEAVVVHDAPAIPPEETAAAHTGAGEGYRAFAPFFAAWRELPAASHEHPLLLRFDGDELESETLPEPAEFATGEPMPKAGSDVARDAFARFMRDDAAHYAPAALVPADDGTSRMSAHLSFGTI